MKNKDNRHLISFDDIPPLSRKTKEKFGLRHSTKKNGHYSPYDLKTLKDKMMHRAKPPTGEGWMSIAIVNNWQIWVKRYSPLVRQIKLCFVKPQKEKVKVTVWLFYNIEKKSFYDARDLDWILEYEHHCCPGLLNRIAVEVDAFEEVEEWMRK